MKRLSLLKARILIGKGKVLLASSEWKPGMLLNVLQGTGQFTSMTPPPTPPKIVSAQRIGSVKVEKSWLTHANALGQGVVVVLEQMVRVVLLMCSHFREV